MSVMWLKEKYRRRPVVKQVSAKSGGGTSAAPKRNRHLPKFKGVHEHTPVRLVVDGGTGKRRWERGG